MQRLTFVQRALMLYAIACGTHAHAANEPTMVLIPAGVFKADKPVSVASFELSKTEVTVAQFRQFVTATKHQTHAERVSGPPYNSKHCWALDEKTRNFDAVEGRTWQKPGWAIADDQPVTCVSWDDANAYIAWLQKETGKRYRLPTDAEWEYAARANQSASLAWRDAARDVCAHENIGDQTKVPAWKSKTFPCKDGHAFAAPVGRFKANAFGLHDLMGNVREWVQDCYKPPKGNAACETRTLRGGSFATGPLDARVEKRSDQPNDLGLSDTGFRLARSLP
jgi:formylglycine-generating enzyme required for sulfatase activity